MTTNDIRWEQRFENYLKAFELLSNAVEKCKINGLSDLEELGLIQRFEFTHELAWILRNRSSYYLRIKKGNYKNGSDIDLVLKGTFDFKNLFRLENKLDDLLLPYKIDLSVYNKIENKAMLEHIDRVGKVFYERGRDRFQLTYLSTKHTKFFTENTVRPEKV